MMPTTPPPLTDPPPDRSELTDYDRAHLKLYMRLLDAEKAGAPWTEVVRRLMSIDPATDRDRAQRLHASHLARARWVSEFGYRDLLQKSG
ncbi:MAG: DNA -binding domain-containing protein [Allosphingosinicella sp.]